MSFSVNLKTIFTGSWLHCTAVTRELCYRGVFVAMDPMPHDKWDVMVKAELPEAVSREAVRSAHESLSDD